MDEITKKLQEEINEAHEQKTSSVEIEEIIEDEPEEVVEETTEETIEEASEEIIEEPEIDSAMINKAIRAGLDYDDVMKIKDKDVLEKIIGLQGNKDTGAKVETKEEVTAESPDLAFLDLDEESFDEDTVTLFSQVKGVLAKQNEIISTLLKERQEEIPSVISGKLSELEAEEQKMVKDKMAILSKGYEVNGISIEPEKLFDEAFKLVSNSSFTDKQKRQLKQRSKQFTNRVPGKKGRKVVKQLSGEELESSIVDNLEKKLEAYRKG